MASAKTRSAQDAVDAFVAAQLLDNGMDAVAKKINRLRAKLAPPVVSDVNTDGNPASELDAAAKRKYARRLQHWLAVACRLLRQQRQQLHEGVEAVEREMKLLAASSTDAAASSSSAAGDAYPTPAQMLASATPASGSFQFTAAAAALALSNEPVLAAGRYVAAKVARSHELWILARVVRFSDASNSYEVEDVDAGDRHHVVPKHQVAELLGDVLPAGEWIQYAVNQRVMAMYPNTTSFYRATIRVPNPKVRALVMHCCTWVRMSDYVVTNGLSRTHQGAPYVILKFEDDADEIGQVPDRKVPFRFVTPLKPWHKH